ncbi:MAG: PAS domain S-box protein, partial [Candidatus Hodarchaeota archaeon]
MKSRILFVDDDKDLLKVSKSLLTKEDPSFELITAVSADEALLKLTSESFDVVVADYQMPRISGLELLEKIRSMGNEIPFIIFTGRGREEVAMQALNLGADFYVKKGGDTRSQYLELAHIIRKAVRYKKTKDALIESELTFRRTFEAIPDPAYLYEQQLDGRIVLTRVNKAGLALSRGKLTEFIGIDLEALHKGEKIASRFLWHGINLSEMAKDVRQVIKTGKTHQLELSYRLPSGDQAWFILEYAKTAENSALLVAKNVTDLKITEKYLRESEEQYRATLDSMTDLIHVIDSNFRFVLFNASFKRQNEELGLETDVIGRNISEVFPFLPDKVIEEYQTVIATGESLVTEESLVIDKREFHTQTIKVPIFEEGAVSRVLTIIRDVTEQKATEIILQESEEYFRTIFAKSPIGIGLFDSDGYLVDANQAALEIAGLSSISELKEFHLLSRPAITDELREKLLMGESVSFQAAYDFEEVREHNLYPTTRSGAAYFDYRITPLEAKDQKQILGFLLQIQDITEKRVTEQVLQEREDLYRGVVEDQTELLCRFLPGGILTFVNSAYCRYFEKTRGQLLGTSIFQFIVKEDQKVLQSQISSLSPENPVIRNEHRILSPEGEERWQHFTVRMIFDEKGSFFEYQGVGRDITEQKRVEEALQQSEARYRSLVETSLDGITVIDLEGKIAFVNQQGLTQYGYADLEEVIGKSGYDFFSPEDQLRAREDIQGALINGHAKNLEYTFVKRDGTRFAGEISLALIRDDNGSPKHYVAYTRDISDRKSAEKALQESEQKYRRLVEESLQGLLIIQDRKVVYANPVIEKVFGYSFKELVDYQTPELRNIIHPDYQEKVREYYDDRLAGK